MSVYKTKKYNSRYACIYTYIYIYILRIDNITDVIDI